MPFIELSCLHPASVFFSQLTRHLKNVLILLTSHFETHHQTSVYYYIIYKLSLFSFCSAWSFFMMYLQFTCHLHDVFAVYMSFAWCICSLHVIFMMYLQFTCHLHDVFAVNMSFSWCICSLHVIFMMYLQLTCHLLDVFAVYMSFSWCICS